MDIGFLVKIKQYYKSLKMQMCIASFSNLKKAFTLAEVLITLGIIGIVAEMTVPVLYNNVQKQTTLIRLKKEYSTINQAIRLSEVDNGMQNTWTYGAWSDGSATLTWFNTYLAPYMKYTKTSTDVNSAYVYLSDGTKMALYLFNNQMHFGVYFDGDNTAIQGKNAFLFLLDTTSTKDTLNPYDVNSTCPAQRGTRAFWTCDPGSGCTKAGGKNHCAGLIMFDGWQISSDYPYFN